MLNTPTHAPSGTVTFLFTDVEGSTRLWQQDPEAMRSALARHHAVLTEAIENHRGYVFQIGGEAFCAAFANATDAVSAANGAQRELQVTADPVPAGSGHAPGPPVPIHVRMGIHTGAAEHGDGKYSGYLTLARVQRLMSAAHGGQVLLSQVTAELVQDQLANGVSLRDLGEHRLRDLARPEHIFQLVMAELPADFPPLGTLDTLPNNLPIQLTSFIGRAKEIAEVVQLLKTTRLLTLTGVGGTGKTRLSLQAAAEVVDTYADSVWFVELAPVSDPALVPKAVAQVLGIREQPDRPLLSTLADSLSRRTLLIVLDNCEHLIDACAQFAESVLHHAARVRILATSREPLGIGGEITYPVPPLTTADTGRLPPVEQVTQFEAVRLFIDRALAVQPKFTLTNANAPAVAQICAQLDGIPLAIELAAARMRALTAEQIAERLDNRFQFLTGGSRTAVPRQQTLRAAVDWSYSLLSEPERIVLRRLSVFAGGWSLEAAEAVCPDAMEVPASSSLALRPPEVLDLLSRLVDRSLVVADRHARKARYHLLETIRQYGQERLREPDALAREEEARLAARHAEYFMQLAERAEPELTGPQQLAWLERLETEHDNLRAALRWSLESRHLLTSLRLCGALWRFWDYHSHTGEGSRWLTDMLGALGSADVPIALCAKVVRGAGVMALRRSDFTQAIEYFQESLRLSQLIGDKRGVAGSLNGLGVATADDLSVTRQYFEQSLALFRELQDRWGIARALSNWAIGHFLSGQNAPAIPLFEQSLALQKEVGDSRLRAMTLTFFGHAVLFEGDLQRADGLLREALTQQQIVGDRVFITYCLNGLAGVAAAGNQGVRAARLLGASEALGESLGSPKMPIYSRPYQHLLEMARQALEPAAFARAWSEGRAITLEQAVADALSGGAGAAEPAGSPSAQPSARQRFFGLTGREQEVTRLVAEGKSNREIADALSLSERTVENHVANIMSKLGFNTRTQVAVWAVEKGLARTGQ